MKRRTVLTSLLAAAAAAQARPLTARTEIGPDHDAWQRLRGLLGDKLLRIRSPLVDCARGDGPSADVLFDRLKNPYYLGEEPALTQTLGWTDAWTSRPSLYAVAANSAADVATAVNFARETGVRLVVKGGGHSYFGNSNAAGSLLVWTRSMRSIELHDDFVGEGCPPDPRLRPAVSIGAGATWGQVYEAVSVRNNQYVQGGGCLTVGVAGLVLGGGFGSFSKAFGTGAANLLEAEVVTADGRVRVVNRCREPDLFFALKGGGGGTFGVVTRLTLRTHDLPSTVGAVQFSVSARSDEAWHALVTRLLGFYADALFNSNWGEQLRFEPGRKLSVSMMFQGLDGEQARFVWAPLFAWIGERPDDFTFAGEPAIIAAAGRSLWDPDFLRSIPGVVKSDDRAGASASSVFWSADAGEAGQVLYAYQSTWLPARLLERQEQAALVDALVAASAAWPVSLHTNKGLAGGTDSAIAMTRDTATNPAVLDAFALLICAANAPPAWPGIPGYEPNLVRGRVEAAQVARAMAPIRALVPGAGTYMSESDYFERDWKQAYWGEHYPQLAATKRHYDPSSTFRTHNGVESS